MNVSKNSKKQSKKLFTIIKSKISIRLVIYTLLIVSIYFFQGLSVYKIWSSRAESIKHDKEWYTESTNKYYVINKLQEHSDSGTKNWMLLKNTETGKVFKLDVTAETYMIKSTGDYVWFTLSKHDEYNHRDIPDSPAGILFSVTWISLFVYLFYLYVIYQFDNKFEKELDSSRTKRNYFIILPIFTTVAAILNGFIFFMTL